MEIDKRLDALEGESRLMKGEVKTAMTNIREFLANIKLAPPEDDFFADVDAKSNKEEGQGNNNPPQPSMPPPEPIQLPGGQDCPLDEPRLQEELGGLPPPLGNEPYGQEPSMSCVPPQTIPAQAPPPQPQKEMERGFADDWGLDQNPLPFFPEEGMPRKKKSSEPPFQNNNEQPEEEHKPERKKELEKDKKKTGITSQGNDINHLVNLIRWISTVKKEIGKESLPLLLDVYSVGSDLSIELRDIILHLAENIDEQPGEETASNSYVTLFNQQLSNFLEVCRVGGQITPETRDAILCLSSTLASNIKINKSEIWSNLILQLHSILGDNEEMFLSRKPLWKREEEKIAESKKAENEEFKNQPVKLKLVLPGSNGEAKEFSLTLHPEELKK